MRRDLRRRRPGEQFVTREDIVKKRADQDAHDPTPYKMPQRPLDPRRRFELAMSDVDALAALEKIKRADLISLAIDLREELIETQIELGDHSKSLRGFAEHSFARRQSRDRQDTTLKKVNVGKTAFKDAWHAFVDRHRYDETITKFRAKTDRARQLIKYADKSNIKLPSEGTLAKYLGKKPR